MTQTASNSKAKNRIPLPNKKKGGKAKLLLEGASDAVEAGSPESTEEGAPEGAEAGAEAAQDGAPAKGRRRTNGTGPVAVARRLVAARMQPAALVKTVVESNPLAKAVSLLEPDRTPLEVYTGLDEASVELGEDPVNIESAMRLLAGLGVCTFVVGRKNRPTRVVWHVGNLADVLKGTATEYTDPQRVTGPVNRPLSTTAMVKLSVAQRAALCKELKVTGLNRQALRAWAEELLASAVAMLASEEPVASSPKSVDA